ncbi:2-isopropylmalate synthase [Chloroflexi bacterium]|nr:2-isopropylmalate synthase [Chloroflexota bacterium]|tara:strand:+ start:977 stop:2500 length:1524 start_codon:yes stop_codon:yes gene_type:complete
MSNNKILIFDTTLRDGEQSAGIGLTKSEKLEIAHQLKELNVDIIEAGFPASSPGDFESVIEISKEIKGPTIAALARCVPSDVDAAWEAIKNAENPRIHVFVNSSDIQIINQLKKNREEVLDMAVYCVEQAKKYCSDVEFSPMDASRTDMDFLYQLIEATVKAGATTINIPDTVGYTMPWEFKQRIEDIINNVPGMNDVVTSVHCHNDLGLSVANSLAAITAGARQIEGCINGLGERAGNAALEEVIMAINTREDLLDVSTDINTKQIYKTSRLVSDITGFPVQPNKAIVGANAFRHASGIHQDGVIKSKSTFEIMDPESIGLTGNSLVLSKLSGRAGLKSRLEDLGYILNKEELDKTFEDFKNLADKKKEVTNQDLEILMSDQKRSERSDNNYELISVNIESGSEKQPKANIKIKNNSNNKIEEATSSGTGPVDAIYKAIDKLIDIKVTLNEWRIEAVTEGIDAIGDAIVRLEKNNSIVIGRGSDTDVLVSSAKAYIDGLNKLTNNK